MEPLWPDRQQLGLLTDLYEMTMAQAYLQTGRQETATFSLFFRDLPGDRNMVVACGQEYAAAAAAQIRFSDEQIERLRSLELFADDFLRWLRDFRFSGDVHAVPEGTVVFPHEPILEVQAPLAEAQLLESFFMNTVNLETLLASKAVRMVLAADGRPVVDFGMRRMHGMEAAWRGTRAYRAAGIAGTSNVLAGLDHGLPLRGTMAHSFVQTYRDEKQALRDYARLYPGTVLLVDTYDTLAAVDKVIELVRDEGLEVGGIRLDSGDLGELSRQCRRKLDDAGLDNIRILVSGGLDEWQIESLVESGAPVDGFGVGTEMGAVRDAPALDFAYKLVSCGGEPRLKNSPGKKLYPGRKQVWRFSDGSGRYIGDEITMRDEGRSGVPLLRPVMESGGVIQPPPDPERIRQRVTEELKAMPDNVRSLRAAAPYPVRFSEQLDEKRAEVLARIANGFSR
jgi:nicotinate phosphoribosyltransferase